jgi:hypothetical protein
MGHPLSGYASTETQSEAIPGRHGTPSANRPPAQNAYWGGEPAAEKLTRYLKPAQFTIYAREPIAKLVAAGRMRADSNGNVEVLDAFWNSEPEKELPDVVPPILVYADFWQHMTGATSRPRG